MSQHRNLEPGTRAPQTGLYACGYCAPGGILDTLTSGLAGLSGSDPAFSSSGEVTIHVEAGGMLPDCERCGTTAGWDLVEGSIEDYRRENAQTQQAVFGNLGLGADGATRPGPHGASGPARHRSTAIWVLVVGAVVVLVIALLVLFVL